MITLAAAMTAWTRLGAPRGIVRWTIEGYRDDVASSLGRLLLHLDRRDAVRLEDLRELSEADADEAGVAHDVEDVGEGDARERVP